MCGKLLVWSPPGNLCLLPDQLHRPVGLVHISDRHLVAEVQKRAARARVDRLHAREVAHGHVQEGLGFWGLRGEEEEGHVEAGEAAPGGVGVDLDRRIESSQWSEGSEHMYAHLANDKRSSKSVHTTCRKCEVCRVQVLSSISVESTGSLPLWDCGIRWSVHTRRISFLTSNEHPDCWGLLRTGFYQKLRLSSYAACQLIHL
jgi:hypothetical protein